MTTASPASSRKWSFGRIPTEWRALPLKYVCTRSSLYGANVAADRYENDGVRFLRTTDIRDDGTLSDGGVYVPADIVADYMLSEGDFLISRSGTVGRAYVYRQEDGPCAYAGYLVRYALRDPDSPRVMASFTSQSLRVSGSGWSRLPSRPLLGILMERSMRIFSFRFRRYRNNEPSPTTLTARRHGWIHLWRRRSG